MGYTYYQYLILIDAEQSFAISDLKQKLEATYANSSQEVEIRQEGDYIEVDIEGYVFSVNLSKEEHVLAESEELVAEAKNTKGTDWETTISRCFQRVEMAGSPDPNMDFFNDSLYVLEAIEGMGKVYTFDPQQNEFVNL